jgi:hypothetical protein
LIKEDAVWSDLPGRLDGKQVTIGLTDGSAVSGKVLPVTNQQITLSPSPRSKTSVSRTDAKVVQYNLVQGKARAGWTIGLLAAGGYAIGRARHRTTVLLSIRPGP